MNWGFKSITTATGAETTTMKEKVYIPVPVKMIAITAIIVLVDLISSIVVPLEEYRYSIGDWWSDQFLHYSFVTSAIDMLVLNMIRMALIGVACKKANEGLAFVKVNGQIVHEKYSLLAFKLCTASAVVAFVKIVVALTADEGSETAWVPSLFTMIICFFECFSIWKLWEATGYSARSSLYEKLVSDDKDPEAHMEKKKRINLVQLCTILKPYFWPSGFEPNFIMNRIRATSTWLLIVLSKILGVIAPLFLGSATNALNDGNYKAAVHGIIWFTVASLAGKILKELQLMVYLKVKQTAYVELAMTSFTHIHKLSLQWHLKKKIGNVMRSMDRGNVAADNLVSYLFLYLVPCLFEIVLTIVVFFAKYGDWKLGVVVIFFMWLYIFATMKLTLWRMGFREKTNVHDNIFHDKATDSIINYETVKYFTNEEFECRWFKDSVRDYIFFSTGVQVSLSVLNMIQAAIVCGTLGCGLLIAANSINIGLYQVGDLVSINVYLSNLFVPLTFLGTVYNIIVQAFVDIQNLTELLDEYPDVQDIPGAKPLQLPAPGSNGMSVHLKDISFCYPEQPPERGLKDINIEVAPGTTTALVGPTGSGKTTVSRLMFRFYDPIKGTVLFNGQDISKVTQKSARGAIGVVPQDTVLFNSSILHNIRYGRVDATMAEIRNAAEAAQILDFVLSLPEQWDTKVGERGLKLSGGEKQRVAIARCLLKNPPIVLLDEATSALDTITESSIQQALQSLSAHRTTVVIAHRLSTTRLADQICVLSLGKIVERGSHNELIDKKGIYHDMWEMQQAERSSESNGDSDLEKRE